MTPDDLPLPAAGEQSHPALAVASHHATHGTATRRSHATLAAVGPRASENVATPTTCWAPFPRPSQERGLKRGARFSPGGPTFSRYNPRSALRIWAPTQNLGLGPFHDPEDENPKGR